MEDRKLSMQELGRMSVEEFKSSERFPVIIALDSVRSALNVGSVFRTSDAFAIEGILLGGITASPPNKEIHKSALGSTESVTWESCSELTARLLALKELGYVIIAIEQTANAVKLNTFTPDKSKKYVLVFGNEVDGVSNQVINMADLSIEIPQYGTKHSLNIAVSVGIVAWEFIRQL